MRILLDTNVLLSYLLSPDSTSSVKVIVDRVFLGTDTLVLPPEVIDELTRTAANKPFFSSRIPFRQVEVFVQALLGVAILAPRLQEFEQRWVRDPKDDFLIVSSLVAGVEVLISGDQDLISMRDLVPELKIRSPQSYVDEFCSR